MAVLVNVSSVITVIWDIVDIFGEVICNGLVIYIFISNMCTYYIVIRMTS
jgi:hypothetical protein